MNVSRPAPGSAAERRIATGLTFLAALVLLISPYLLGYADLSGAANTAILFGLAIATVAAIRSGWRTAWLSWLSALLGVALLVSPWIVGFTNATTPFWTVMVSGLVVVLLSIWRAAAARDAIV
jgi:hypothetical protein